LCCGLAGFSGQWMNQSQQALRAAGLSSSLHTAPCGLFTLWWLMGSCTVCTSAPLAAAACASAAAALLELISRASWAARSYSCLGRLLFCSTGGSSWF
jgi:hypothetical protein